MIGERPAGIVTTCASQIFSNSVRPIYLYSAPSPFRENRVASKFVCLLSFSHLWRAGNNPVGTAILLASSRDLNQAPGLFQASLPEMPYRIAFFHKLR